jgi:hypothetical protein
VSVGAAGAVSGGAGVLSAAGVALLSAPPSVGAADGGATALPSIDKAVFALLS